jgi:hypothetical protein
MKTRELTDMMIKKEAKQYDKSAFCGHFAGEEPSYHFRAGALFAKRFYDQVSEAMCTNCGKIHSMTAEECYKLTGRAT